MKSVRDSEYLKHLYDNRWGCKYRKLHSEFKKAFQDGYNLFESLKERPDYPSDQIKEIHNLLIKRMDDLLFTKGTISKRTIVKEHDKIINSKIALLPEV